MFLQLQLPIKPQFSPFSSFFLFFSIQNQKHIYMCYWVERNNHFKSNRNNKFMLATPSENTPTPSENTGLWQLPNRSSDFKKKLTPLIDDISQMCVFTLGQLVWTCLFSFCSKCYFIHCMMNLTCFTTSHLSIHVCLQVQFCLFGLVVCWCV